MKNDEISDEEKIIESCEALKSFFDLLGPNDIYKQILLETFFAYLYNIDVSEIDSIKEFESKHEKRNN
jgi:hypothetical protein